MTDVEQRRLRDSWGLIGVVLIATFYLGSALFRAMQQDWTAAATNGVIAVLVLGVLAFSLTRRS